MDNEELQVIAIDLGFGDTKVVSKNKSFKFASAIERKKESNVQFDDSVEDDVYLFKGKYFTVGDNALNNALSTRGFNFLVKYSQLIIFHAIRLAELDINKPIKVITGLSILNWEERKEFVEAISSINVNSQIIKPDIELMAQGQGIFIDAKVPNEGMVCVVDIGYNTFDFLAFENGMPRQDLSFATKTGANIIITELQTKLKNVYKFDVTEQKAKEVFMNGYLLHYGEKIDLTDEIEEAKADYAEYIMDELRAQRVEILRMATYVIFGGGGSYFLDEQTLPQNCVLSSSPLEFANARGYYEKK